MVKIQETETTSELKKVEETTTVERIKCDVCGHEYDGDNWDGKEFAVNPDINRQVHSILELDDLFDAYHIDVPTHVVDDGYDGSEMHFEVPKEPFFDVLSEELPIAMERQQQPDQARLAAAGLRAKYSDKLVTKHFYIKDNTIHHFMYEIDIEASPDDHKHVCSECYEVIFDDT